MKKINLLFLSIFILLLSMSVVSLAEEDEIIIHVSPDGDDLHGDGSIEKPLATLEGARVKVAGIEKSAPITVLFHEGQYFFDKMVRFDVTDSGTESCPITYRSADGEKAVFTGAKKLNVNALKPVTDKKILARLPESARGKVAQLDLRENGIESIGEFNKDGQYVNLFFNNVRQTPSRWPNSGFRNIKQVLSVTSQLSSFRYSESEPSRWTTAENAYIIGYLGAQYFKDTVKLKSVDTITKTITVEGKTSFGISQGARYMAVNLLEEIDLPGEWYIDRENMILYWYPAYSLKNSTLELSVLNEDFIFLAKGEYIRFKDITMTKCNSNAVRIYSNNNCIENCDISYVGKIGLSVSGNNTLIKDNRIHNIGTLGISIGGGDRNTLTSSNNRVVNNHIYSIAEFEGANYCRHVGIYSGVGVVVENNIMHGCTYHSIGIRGNEHVIKGNEVYNAVREALDSCAIGHGRSWSQYGNEISYNYIHDTYPYNAGTGPSANAIFLDDLFSGARIHHNIIKVGNQINTGGIKIGGGRDNVFTNNTVIDCKYFAIGEDRTYGVNNVEDSSYGRMALKTLYEVPYNQSPFLEKYPRMANILNDEPLVPKYNVIKDNVYVDAEERIAQRMIDYGDVENNIKSDYSIFVDPENQDYRVKSSSDVYGKVPGILGEEFDLDSIGLQLNENIVELEKPSSEFRLLYPKNGDADVQTPGTQFKWEDALYADKYRLVIATDAEMKNVVYDEYTGYSSVCVDILKEGNINYYWKVYAICESRQLYNVWESVGDPYLLTTAKNYKLNKVNLENYISFANDFYTKMVEGDDIGQFYDGVKSEVKKGIEKAKEIAEMAVGTQKMIDDAYEELKTLIRTADLKRHIGFRGIDKMLLDSKNWVIEDTSKFKLTNGKMTTSCLAGYGETVSSNEIICFTVTPNVINWFGLALKQGVPNVKSYSTASYLIVIKEDIIELQRNGIVKIVPNKYIKNGKPCEIQFGAINEGENVRIILSANGYEVLNYLDSATPIATDGHFVVLPSGGDITIEASNNVPNEWFVNKGEERDFTEYSIPNVTDVAEFINDSEGWSAYGGTLISDDKSASLKVKDENGVMIYNNVKQKDILLEFGYDFGFMSDNTDKYHAFALRAVISDGVMTDGYYIKVYKDKAVLMRYNNGECEVLAIMGIENLGKSDVKLGAYDVHGGTKIVFETNGRLLLEYIDINPISTGRDFAVFGNANAYVSITKSKEVNK